MITSRKNVDKFVEMVKSARFAHGTRPAHAKEEAMEDVGTSKAAEIVEGKAVLLAL